LSAPVCTSLLTYHTPWQCFVAGIGVATTPEAAENHPKLPDLPPNCLYQIFDQLPHNVKVLTVKLLSKAHKAWVEEHLPGSSAVTVHVTSTPPGPLRYLPMWPLLQQPQRLRRFSRMQQDSLMAVAAQQGDLGMVKWLHCCVQRMSVKVNYVAALRGRLKVLKWAHSKSDQDRWAKSEICYAAAKGGHLAVLQWARTVCLPPCPWDVKTCRCAAANGHLEVLRWARQEGCPWDEQTCTAAARHGHLPVLRWARENGCPWDKQTCIEAAAHGHLDCLQWARGEGCPCDWPSVCAVAAKGGHQGVLVWARGNGA
jgi:hypothetical protein